MFMTGFENHKGMTYNILYNDQALQQLVYRSLSINFLTYLQWRVFNILTIDLIANEMTNDTNTFNL